MTTYDVRRNDRELTDPTAIASVLRRGRFATVAMCQEGEPYLVTLSYGHDTDANALFFHMAKGGRKLDAIAADPRVCATVVIDGGYEQGGCKHHYESVVLRGTMRLVDDPAERRRGMRVLLAHLEDDPEEVWEHNRLEGDTVYERVSVARLDIDEITGKAGS
jgi:uncharacterized protein